MRFDPLCPILGKSALPTLQNRVLVFSYWPNSLHSWGYRLLDSLQSRVYSSLHEYCYLPPCFVPQRPEDRQPESRTGSMAETSPLSIGAMVRGSRERHDYAAGCVSTLTGRHCDSSDRFAVLTSARCRGKVWVNRTSENSADIQQWRGLLAARGIACGEPCFLGARQKNRLRGKKTRH